MVTKVASSLPLRSVPSLSAIPVSRWLNVPGNKKTDDSLRINTRRDVYGPAHVHGTIIDTPHNHGTSEYEITVTKCDLPQYKDRRIVATNNPLIPLRNLYEGNKMRPFYGSMTDCNLCKMDLWCGDAIIICHVNVSTGVFSCVENYHRTCDVRLIGRGIHFGTP